MRFGLLASLQNIACFSAGLNVVLIALFCGFFCAWIAANIAKKSRNKMLLRMFGLLLFFQIFGPKPFPATHFNISAVGFLYFWLPEFFYHFVAPSQSVTVFHFKKTPG